MEWELLIGNSTDPYYNLAREEVLFNSGKNCIAIWQNGPSVIIGRHQNTMKEADLQILQELSIPIVRRLTGGGAVYHDEGNVNFSFFFNCDETSSFEETMELCLEWMVDFLHQQGITTYKSGRNDLCVMCADGTERKISGCAMMQRGTRGIFHATLLYDADLEMMTKVLTPSREKLQAKGTDSVRSRVMNLRQMKDLGSVHVILDHAAMFFFGKVTGEFNEDAEFNRQIEDLREKYCSWEWNFGRDPACNFSVSRRLSAGTVELELELNKGIIEECHVYGDFIDIHPVADITSMLKGISYSEKLIDDAMSCFMKGDGDNEI